MKLGWKGLGKLLQSTMWNLKSLTKRKKLPQLKSSHVFRYLTSREYSWYHFYLSFQVSYSYSYSIGLSLLGEFSSITNVNLNQQQIFSSKAKVIPHFIWILIAFHTDNNIEIVSLHKKNKKLVKMFDKKTFSERFEKTPLITF